MAVVAALSQNRYHAMVTAMEQVQLEPVIIEDLVKFGEDRGYDRGQTEGYDRGQTEGYVRLFARRLGRALTDVEHEKLKHRIETLGVDRIDEILLTRKPAAIAAWFADPDGC